MYKRAIKFRQTVKDHHSIDVGVGPRSARQPKGRGSDLGDAVVRPKSAKAEPITAKKKKLARVRTPEEEVERRERRRAMREKNQMLKREYLAGIAKQILESDATLDNAPIRLVYRPGETARRER